MILLPTFLWKARRSPDLWSGFFTVFINNLETGKWGVTSTLAMSAMAEKIASQSHLLPSSATELMENYPPKLLRTWDLSGWGTYLVEVD